MLHRVHASAYHWLHAAGVTAANRARSQWLCSRVHAVAGQPEGALNHARRCLARAQAATIANPHDAEHIEADLDALPL